MVIITRNIHAYVCAIIAKVCEPSAVMRRVIFVLSQELSSHIKFNIFPKLSLAKKWRPTLFQHVCYQAPLI